MLYTKSLAGSFVNEIGPCLRFRILQNVAIPKTKFQLLPLNPSILSSDFSLFYNRKNPDNRTKNPTFPGTCFPLARITLENR